MEFMIKKRLQNTDKQKEGEKKSPPGFNHS